MNKRTARQIVSKHHQEIFELRRKIQRYFPVIKKAKEDISACIVRGIRSPNDFVPYEPYRLATAISNLKEARFEVNHISKKISLLKKELELVVKYTN